MLKTKEDVINEINNGYFEGEIIFTHEDENGWYFQYGDREQIKVRKDDYALMYRFNNEDFWNWEFDLFAEV